MNLANKYIDAEDIESVGQLKQMFEAARSRGTNVPDSFISGAIDDFKHMGLAYIRFGSEARPVRSDEMRLLPKGYTRIKPADILEPDYYDGEWHDWHGGECPVSSNVEVEVEFRSGSIRKGIASHWTTCWMHYNSGGDIIRFRVLNSTTEEQPMGHPRASLLREIAQEAERNELFWESFQSRPETTKSKVFEWQDITSVEEMFNCLRCYLGRGDLEVRRKPRTVSVSGEVPVDVFDNAEYLVNERGEDDYKSYLVAKALLDLRTGADND